jgi:hypothetical protein
MGPLLLFQEEAMILSVPSDAVHGASWIQGSAAAHRAPSLPKVSLSWSDIHTI